MDKGNLSGYAILTDPKASMKAKGLYFTIKQLQEKHGEALRKTDVLKKIPEGKLALNSAWKELKALGYMRLHGRPSEKGWNFEIELLDKPNPYGPHTIYYGADGRIARLVCNGDEGEVD